MYALRPYQVMAVKTIVRDLFDPAGSRFALLQAVTGSGKTVMFSALARALLHRYPDARVCVLAHRKELVEQAYAKMDVSPLPREAVAVACASCEGDTPVEPKKHRVVIGSVQTLARRDVGKINLLIIDEAHHVPPIEQGGQYHKIINRLSALNPTMGVLGVTATPYRLGHGLIYGPTADGLTNVFPKLNHAIGGYDLLEAGLADKTPYVEPVRGKHVAGAGLEEELGRVATTGGEYNGQELNRLMTRKVHIDTAVKAYEDYGEGRQHCLAFGVTIEHAELLARAFNGAGHPAAAIHSQMPAAKRAALLKAFEKGALKVLCNVGVLTEGWDCPPTDLIVMARPTLSTSLFVQMCGRGTRPWPGKHDVLVLDLAGNFARHDDPWDPIVQPGQKPTMWVCPNCGEALRPWEDPCPQCGYRRPPKEEPAEKRELPPVETERQNLVDVSFGAAGDDVVTDVRQWYGNILNSRRGQPFFVLSAAGANGRVYKQWLDIEGLTSGYGQVKARRAWQKFSRDGYVPETLADAEAWWEASLALPATIHAVRQGNGFMQIQEFN